MTHRAERRLAHIDNDIRWLRQRLPTALTNLEHTTPTGYPTGGDGTRSGGPSIIIKNPDGTTERIPATGVEMAAIAGYTNRTRYTAIDALAAEASGIIARLCAEVRAVTDPGVDTDTEARHARCSGGTDTWARPECQALSVKTLTVRTGLRLPLCSSCITRWKRSDEYSQRPSAAA